MNCGKIIDEGLIDEGLIKLCFNQTYKNKDWLYSEILNIVNLY